MGSFQNSRLRIPVGDKFKDACKNPDGALKPQNKIIGEGQPTDADDFAEIFRDAMRAAGLLALRRSRSVLSGRTGRVSRADGAQADARDWE